MTENFHHNFPHVGDIQGFTMNPIKYIKLLNRKNTWLCWLLIIALKQNHCQKDFKVVATKTEWENAAQVATAFTSTAGRILAKIIFCRQKKKTL